MAYKEADHNVCSCPTEEKNIVYLDSIKSDNGLDSLDECYCITCNSFWRVP